MRAGMAGVEALRALVGPLEAVIVDDGSTDRTVVVAEGLAAQSAVPVHILREPHRGKGGALRAGVRAASGERILLMDVDWSVAPLHVLDVLAAPGDVVCAVREGPGARRVGEPEWRHKLGRGFNWLVRGWVYSGHEDTQCGCKVLERAAAQALFADLTVEGWAYDVELIALAHLRGYSVRDVPVVWRYEQDSRLRPLRDGWEMLKDLRRVRANVRGGRYRVDGTGAPPVS